MTGGVIEERGWIQKMGLFLFLKSLFVFIISSHARYNVIDYYFCFNGLILHGVSEKKNGQGDATFAADGLRGSNWLVGE